MKRLFYFLPCLLLVSCQNTSQNLESINTSNPVVENKLYAITIVSEEKDTFGKSEILYSEPEVIEAMDDSIAFCKAVEKFYIEVYATIVTKNDMKKLNAPSDGKDPQSFILNTSEGLDISDGAFLKNPKEIIEQTDQKIKKRIEKEL